MYTTFPSVSSIMCTDSQLGRELRAYIYWIEPLWRVLKVPLEQTCPLFENHCFRLRNKYSVSKISMRKQSLWSITEAMGRTLSLTFSPPPPLFFPCSFIWPFLELRGLRERIWVGGAREKAFSDKLRASRDPATSNSPPTGTFQHWKVETFFPQESCVVFQSLTVEPLIHMEEVHRGNRHCQVQSCIQPRLWGQGKQLSLETHKTCSTPLRAERQKHTNFFRSCLISFPHIKYPIFLTLGGSCGMASCSQNIRKHNAKKKENRMLLPLSPSFLVHKMSLLLCFPLTSMP